MGYHILVIAVIGLILAMIASAQTKPKPCCFPAVYTSDVSILSLQPAMEGQPEQLVLGETVYYFDKPNKRIALNLTAKVLNSEDPEQHAYQIQDYLKDLMYIIVDDTCIKIPLEDGFPTDDYCVPKDAVYNGAAKLGETLAVDRWLFTDDQVTRLDITTTEDECAPVALVGAVGAEDILMISYEYFNFKPSINKPDKKFTPPASCNNAPIQRMPHRVKKLPFGIHLMNP